MAKRNLTAEEPTEVAGPDPLKSVERMFGEAMESMVDVMSRIYRNQALKGLDKETVKKFEDSAAIEVPVRRSRTYPVTRTRTRFFDGEGIEYDKDELRRAADYGKDIEVESVPEEYTSHATEHYIEWQSLTLEQHAQAYGFQDANFAREFLEQARRITRKLKQRFSFDRLERLAFNQLDPVNKRGREEFYKRVSEVVGIDPKRLANEEGLQARTNAMMLETAKWAEKLRDETLEMYTANSLRAMAEGKTLDDVLSQFDGMQEKRKNHAKMVARTQVATFNSLMTKARAENLGITKAVWVTSQDERVRTSHQKRNGKEFDLDEGLYSSVDGKTLLPGVDYNCFPGSTKINHASLCQKLYRRWYTGELTEIVRDDGVVLSATPNHPILTVNGFKPAGLIDTSDNLICTVEQGSNGIELYANDMVPTFEELFGAIDLLGIEHSVSPAISGQFHGDTSDSDIDVVSVDSLLVSEVNPALREKFAKLNLSSTDKMIVLEAFTCLGVSNSGADLSSTTPDSIVSAFNLLRSGLLIHLTPLELFGFALGAWADADFEKSLSDNIASDAEMFSDCVFALAVLVHGLDVFDRKADSLLSSTPLGDCDPDLLKLLGESGGVHANLLCGVSSSKTASYKLCGVTDNRRINGFSGHVYNLQTMSGDYIADTTAVSNCRCTYKLVIPKGD